MASLFLGRLPWELLYDAQSGFLANGNRRMLVVRHLEVPQPEALPEAEAPLRILAASACPRALPALDLAGEFWQLQSALSASTGGAAGTNLGVELLAHATRTALRARLLRRPGPQVLHLMCHGTAQPGDAGAAVFLESERGDADRVGAAELASLIADTGLRLVVLNACSGAVSPEGGGSGLAMSVAAALLDGGIPAAVAMQSAILDRTAVAFSTSFYSRLAAGDLVGEAVNEARRTLAQEQPESFAWCSPVVFLRGADLGIAGSCPIPPPEPASPPPHPPRGRAPGADAPPPRKDAADPGVRPPGEGTEPPGRHAKRLALLAAAAGALALAAWLAWPVLLRTHRPPVGIERIDVAEASRHIDETKTVCGLLVKVRYEPDATGKPTYLEFGKDYPDQVFSGMIWDEYRARFEQQPLAAYEGKRLCVTGRIGSYAEKPDMKIEEPAQLTLDQP